MEKLRFDCGCEFEVIQQNPLKVKYIPKIVHTQLNCERTWKFIQSGQTKGMFQIESQLGKMLAKKLKPENIEHLSALVAIMRPGCVCKDTKVIVGNYTRKNGTKNLKKISIEKLYKNKHLYTNLLSVDEQTGQLVENKIKDVLYTGIKPVYKVKIRSIYRHDNNDFYDLRCTDDHKLLTIHGWKELKDIVVGERILVVKHHHTSKAVKSTKGKHYFKEIAFKHYQEHCVFCDWNKGSLDVNHLEGNRQTNNEPENLNYFCPNHHREYSENAISKAEVIEARQKFKLPQYENFIWGEYLGKEYVEDTDVYDIMMEGPHHNFIAGNTVVHNCMESFEDEKSITNHYIDRKNNIEPVKYYVPALEPILKSTYGCLIYQEQILAIAKQLAGFTLQEADELRRAVGKKKPELMAKCKKMFKEKAKAVGILTEEQADTIFDWIEKSQRYLFNKSHSISYAYTCYLTAYSKAHFPRAFMTSYLRYAKDKTATKKNDEIKELVNDSRSIGIVVKGPDVRRGNVHFKLFDKEIYFGLSNISGIGEKAAETIINNTKNMNFEKVTWPEFLVQVGQFTNSKAFENLIEAGAIDFLGISRNQMLLEYKQFCDLTEKEVTLLTGGLSGDHNSLEYYLEQLVKKPTGRAGISSEARRTKIKGLLDILKHPPHSTRDTSEWISGVEEAKLGVNISASRLDDNHSAKCANSSCVELSNGGHRDYVLLACVIKNIRENTIKRGPSEGRKMAFMKVEDETGIYENVVVFSDAWEANRSVLIEKNTVMLGGEIKRNKETESLIVQQVFQI